METGSGNISRRNFLAASGAGALGAVMGTGACLAFSDEAQAEDGSGQAASSSQNPHTFADTVAWNAEYDVVVIGFGGAGAQASIYAADAGAKVLVCEKAPKGDEGGNTRLCDQCILAANDADRMYNYIIDLCGTIDHDEDAIRAYSQGLAEIPDDLAYLGIDEPVKWSENPEMVDKFPGLMPEYSDSAYGDAVEIYTVHRVISDSAVWKALKRNVYQRSDSISVWLDSPATHLIKDPASGAIVGVEVNKQGEDVLVRANNGVVLACGGYEANDTMLQNFIGATHYALEGTYYNTGDGIKMAQEVGADLWHVGNFASYGIPYDSLAVQVTGQERIDYSLRLPTSGSLFIASDDGSRYLPEDSKNAHGRLFANGKWHIPPQMEHPHLIFDGTELEEIKALGLNMEKLEKRMVSAETAEELAALIEADPDTLSNQIDAFNHFAQEGVDYQFGRAPESMRAFDGGTLYAIAYSSILTNTQGGPRRNADAQIVDTNGNPIPHLYSAGELGSVWVSRYQGAGNVAECLAYGKIAGKNAATPKDPLPETVLPEVEPDIIYGIGKGDLASEPEEPVELGDNQYLGTSDEGMGGVVRLRITYADGTLTNVEVVEEHETPGVGEPAFDQLISSALQSNGETVDAVSGATLTSAAFIEALYDAMSQVA